MWTTPAPPSTALVAASIWSGTGEVNTAPGQAASSMPMPTKPPCIGSCPEPPPEISDTLPCLGANLLTRIWFSGAYRSRSLWAAASPARDSGTRFSGSLRNFLIFDITVAIYSSPTLKRTAALVRGGSRGLDRFRLGHRLLNGILLDPRVGKEVVDKSGYGSTGQARDKVHGDVLDPVR